MKRVVGGTSPDEKQIVAGSSNKPAAPRMPNSKSKNPRPGAASTPQASIAELRDPGFSQAVIAWQKQHGRHALPWQNTRDAYRVWLSEIMLQQTQVAAVIPYYLRFLQTFPDVQTLAAASAEQVMSHWSGLGYYSRARNLHQCAQRVVADHAGVFPADPLLLQQLPGIGRSTAAAIAAFAYGARAAILDGNVKRVFARVFGIDRYPGEKAVEDALWQRAVALLPEPAIASANGSGIESGNESDIESGIESGIESYTQGLMDLGATLCTRNRPACDRCPLASRCVAYETGRTAQLPVRKPKKTVPEKYAAMLIVQDGDQVLLEQRPNHGIWGGLLSLPQISVADQNDFDGLAREQNMTAELQQEMTRVLTPFGAFDRIENLPPLAHGFTHFKLHIAPYRIRLTRRLQSAGQLTHVWYAISDLADAPLPAPVKKLLLELR